MKKIVKTVLLLSLIFSLSGCAMLSNLGNELKGMTLGNEYNITFYDNSGFEFMSAHGKNIGITPNYVYEKSFTSDGDVIRKKTLSSVVTVTLDGKEIESCGTTMIFAETGLEPEVEFTTKDIDENGGTVAYVAKLVNEYKNYFGKSRVAVIQSQLGNPICAFSGDSVYWEVVEDLPKTTKLMIDGNALYIHRANFQIIDLELLN